MTELTRQHLARAQQRMKHQADKNRSERVFQVGDQVYLRLQPYVQTSVANRSSQKLGFKYFGPYYVLKRVGQVSYKLKLPETAKIHLVIHVSQLKKAIKATDTVSTELPVSLVDFLLVQPIRVTDERFIRRGAKMVPQLKVQWSGMPSNCDTWENLFAIVDVFPSATAWGQAVSSGGDSASGDQGHQPAGDAPRDSGDASARKAGPPASIAIVQGRLIATAASGQRHQLYCYSNLTRSSLSSLPSSPELRLVRIHQLCETRRCILRLNPRLIVRIQCVRDLGYYTWYQSHRSTKIATKIATKIHQNPHQNSPKNSRSEEG
jgi:hypothetical protein